MEQKLSSLNIDFDKISSQLDKRIEYATQDILKESPYARLSEVERITLVSKAVCLTMLQDYHDELMDLLNKTFCTTAGQVHPE